MPTTDNPMQPLTALNQQYAEALAQAEALTGQIKAAVRREADLRQQLNAAQAELSRLGLMQLGRKMMIKAEQDSIRKKLAANHQLQESLLARQQACHDQQSALEAQIADAKSSSSPAEAPISIPEPTPIADIIPEPTIPQSRRKPASPRSPRAPKLDASLPVEEQVRQLTARLEALYPQRQVFALDSIIPDMHGKLNAVAPICGCANAAELLARQGFSIISGMQGRALHAGQHCVPGDEPEVIRPLLSSVMRRLEKHYPDRVIIRSIQSEHKSLAQDVCALYQWLGYPSAAAMLTAYGFEHRVTSGGRPAMDIPALLEALRAASTPDEKPRTIAQLMAAHPDLSSALKTLQNQAPARLGMPLKQYLTEQGILAGKGTQPDA